MAKSKPKHSAPRPEESDNLAATGLSQPSENPAPDQNLPSAAREAEESVSEIRRELDAEQETGRQGQVEVPGDQTPNDRYVGPDIGGRRSSRRKP